MYWIKKLGFFIESPNLVRVNMFPLERTKFNLTPADFQSIYLWFVEYNVYLQAQMGTRGLQTGTVLSPSIFQVIILLAAGK